MKKKSAASPGRKWISSTESLSEELFVAQKNLRILSFIGWDDTVLESYKNNRPFASDVRKLYKSRPPKFVLKEKLAELSSLHSKISSKLDGCPLQDVMLRRVHDYEQVAELIYSRGSAEFGHRSTEIWGSSKDKLFGTGTTVAGYAKGLREIISKLMVPEMVAQNVRVLSAEAAAELMRTHFLNANFSGHIEIVISDKLVANASAGRGKISLKKGATFSVKDIDVLIHHEGYTHVATTANGRAQRHATFLGFDSPRCTSTQEGLAVLMEIFTRTTFPQRILKVADRVLAVEIAEEGGSFRDVVESYKDKKYSDEDAYQLASRVFRGTNLKAGQAFTKDVAYLKGLVECFNFIQFCFVRNKAELIPFLFAGKLHIEDVNPIYQAHKLGLVDRPAWVPVQFQDLAALSSWFICSSALGQLSDLSYHQRFETIVTS